MEGEVWLDLYLHVIQGGRSRQPFSKHKNGHKIFVMPVFAIFTTFFLFFRLIGDVCGQNRTGQDKTDGTEQDGTGKLSFKLAFPGNL